MEGDSFSDGHEFESQHHILDGHFSHLFALKFVMLFEKTKINEKEEGVGPFKKRYYGEITYFNYPQASLQPSLTSLSLGQEPWSSGYCFERPWVRIPVPLLNGHFSQ